MTEEHDQEQPTQRIPWKHMQITTFAWDEKVNQVKTLQQQQKQLIEALEQCIELGECQLDYGGSMDALEKVAEIAYTALQQIQGNK